MRLGVQVVVVGDGADRVAAVASRLTDADGRLDATTATDRDAVAAAIEDGADCLLVTAEVAQIDALAVLAKTETRDVPLVVVADDLGDPVVAAAREAGADAVVPAAGGTDTDGGVAAREGGGDGDGDGADDAAVAVDGDRLARHVRAVAGSDAEPSPMAVLERLDVPAWVVRDGTVVEATDACAELLGHGPGGLAGTPLAKLVAPADRERATAHHETLAAGERERRADELTLLGRWGDRVLVEVDGRRLDDRGTVLDTLTDVATDRLDQRRLSALFEEAGQPIAEVALADGRAVLRRANAAFEETFGAGLVGERLDEHVVPDEPAADERAIDIYLRAERGQTVTEVVPRVTADGLRDFRVQATPFETGGERRAMLSYVDVDERTSRERSLEAIQGATRDLLAASDRAAVARVGVEAVQRVLDVELAVVYGYDETEDALVPLSASDAAATRFDPVPTVERGGGPTWYVYAMGETLRADDVAELRAGPDRPVTSELMVPVGDHGLLVASATEAGAFDDTDEALAKTLASTLAAALDRAEREALLRERERRLRRQNERLDEFAGIVSHDLRSPLTVMKGNASLLRDEGEVEYLDRIEAAIDRMDDLVENLLALARQGQTVDETTFVDLADVASDAWTTADTRTADLETEVGVTLDADPGRLQQLLENLFNNAVEHGGDDVTVSVGAFGGGQGETGGAEGFYVADDGAGLPGDPEELFEAGVTHSDDGTGFGLAIVQRIAEAHGWEVRATESEAGGARFEFTGVEVV